MTLHVDIHSPIPIYYQIREQLRQQILGGQLNPGDMLPTEMEICAECGISRMTARQALSQLAYEGLVVRQRGRGTFIAAPKATLDSSQFPLQGYTELLSQMGMQAGALVLAQVVEPATEAVAAQLKVNPGDPLVRITRQRLMRSEPMSLETSFYPHSRCPGLADLDLADRSVYRLIEERYDITPAYATDTVELSVAGAYEARELKISEGVPVVLVTRLSFLEDDTPLEFTQTIHRGDRFKSVVHRTRQQLK
ncbi:MAG: GntR family transcriptional regulator [Chloroflexi bacterium]|nr:GntR family transcriptional regulator [Chloroflexota bacterium]